MRTAVFRQVAHTFLCKIYKNFARKPRSNHRTSMLKACVEESEGASHGGHKIEKAERNGVQN